LPLLQVIFSLALSLQQSRDARGEKVRRFNCTVTKGADKGERLGKTQGSDQFFADYKINLR